MRKVGSIFCIILSCICFFMLGVYADATFMYDKVFKIHRWIITLGMGIFFLVYGIKRFVKMNNDKK